MCASTRMTLTTMKSSSAISAKWACIRLAMEVSSSRRLTTRWWKRTGIVRDVAISWSTRALKSTLSPATSVRAYKAQLSKFSTVDSKYGLTSAVSTGSSIYGSSMRKRREWRADWRTRRRTKSINAVTAGSQEDSLNAIMISATTSFTYAVQWRLVWFTVTSRWMRTTGPKMILKGKMSTVTGTEIKCLRNQKREMLRSSTRARKIHKAPRENGNSMSTKAKLSKYKIWDKRTISRLAIWKKEIPKLKWVLCS